MGQNVRVPPFGPKKNNCTIKVPASTTSGNAPVKFDNILPQAGGAFNKSASVRLFNGGANTVFFELVADGGGNVTADINTSIPLAPNSSEKFTTGGATAIVAVTEIGTSTLYATPGEGL